MRPDRRQLRAGGDHGCGSCPPRTGAGRPATFGLGSAQPRCGRGSGWIQCLTGETPGALFGLVPRPGSSPSDHHPWRGGGGRGGGLSPAPSGAQAQPAAARRPTASGLEGCQPAGEDPAPSCGRADWAGRARIKPRTKPSSGLHRQPRPQLAGGVRPPHQSSRAGAHRSQPAGEGLASRVCQRRLRCDRRKPPSGLWRLGSTGSAGAGGQSRALAGSRRASRRIGPITTAATLEPPGQGPAASRRWRCSQRLAAGRCLLGTLCMGAQRTAVALEASH